MNTRGRALVRELRSYVERVDGQPGLSRVDMLDFARRADLPELAVRRINTYTEEFYDLALGGGGFYSINQLEMALQSYKGE